MAYLAEYTADIHHMAGHDNIAAETLSRPPGQLPSSPPPAKEGGSAGACSSSPASMVSILLPVQSSTSCLIILAAIAADQNLSSDSTALAANKAMGTIKFGIGEYHILCSTATGTIRPIVPGNHRHAVFPTVHSLAHLGIRVTRQLISSRWVWKGMSTNIAAWCRDCQHCQQGKVTQQFTSPVQPIVMPSCHFSHIHINLVGPLPSCSGTNHLLTIVDRSTWWLEAIPLQSTTATAIANALVAGWMARFGVTVELTSDRGVQFSSDVWAVLMSRLGIRHHLTTAYQQLAGTPPLCPPQLESHTKRGLKYLLSRDGVWR